MTASSGIIIHGMIVSRKVTARSTNAIEHAYSIENWGYSIRGLWQLEYSIHSQLEGGLL